MPLQPETMFMLASVPNEVLYPVGGAIGVAFTAMGKAIQVLYKNGREDSIGSISALKDAAHALVEQNSAIKESATALKEQAATLSRQAEALDRIAIYIHEDGRKRASGD